VSTAECRQAVRAVEGSRAGAVGSPRSWKLERDAVSQLPLAAASVRLRGRPGRPRLRLPDSESGAPPASPPLAALYKEGCASTVPRLDERRLLDVLQTAQYLGNLGEDTVRELDASGVLAPARVSIPGRRGQPLRKVLFDRAELDRFIAGWRTAT
jgi:hypothetical protein